MLDTLLIKALPHRPPRFIANDDDAGREMVRHYKGHVGSLNTFVHWCLKLAALTLAAATYLFIVLPRMRLLTQDPAAASSVLIELGIFVGPAVAAVLVLMLARRVPELSVMIMCVCVAAAIASASQAAGPFALYLAIGVSTVLTLFSTFWAAKSSEISRSYDRRIEAIECLTDPRLEGARRAGHAVLRSLARADINAVHELLKLEDSASEKVMHRWLGVDASQSADMSLARHLRSASRDRLVLPMLETISGVRAQAFIHQRTSVAAADAMLWTSLARVYLADTDAEQIRRLRLEHEAMLERVFEANEPVLRALAEAFEDDPKLDVDSIDRIARGTRLPEEMQCYANRSKA